MSKNLIIFIDSFPWESLSETKFLSSFFKTKAKVMPGLGYSINVKAEIFGGYTPDEVGYLCEWMYSSKSHLRKYYPLFLMLSPVSNIYYLDRVIHKIVSRLLGMNIFNIPFRYLRYFKKAGVCAYEDEFSHPTVLTRMNGLKKALYSRYSSVGDRDKYVFEEAKEAIDADIYQNIFVASADLDHLTHRVGVGSGEHRKKIASLDKQLKEICLLFAKKNPDGNICVFSDHGMANTTKSVTIDLEKVFGRANEDRYIYFIDSTMLRIWVFDKGLEKEIKSYLKNLDYGKSLNQDERKKFGIVSKEFGSIIFLLNEGIVFCPSFFGKGILKAMHGYHPELESQLGMFLSNRISIEKDRISTKEIFSILQNTISF